MRYHYKENQDALVTLAKYLREKRKEHGYTQLDMCKFISSSLKVPTISNFENGKCNNFLLMFAYMRLLLTTDEMIEITDILLKNNLYGLNIKR